MSAVRAAWLAVLAFAIVAAIVSYAIVSSSTSGPVCATLTVSGRTVQQSGDCG